MFTSRRISTSGTGFQDSRSCHFDNAGDGDIVSLGSALNLNIATGYYTIAFWGKREQIGYTDRVFHAGSSGGNKNFIVFNSDDSEIYIEADSDDNRIQKGALYETQVVNKWYHYAFASKGDGTGQWYQDGIALSMTTQTGVMTDNFKPDHIGWGFNGKLNEVVIYEKELNASQIRTIYNDREPYNHKEGAFGGNLIHWWRMGDGKESGSGTTIYDEAGSNNGTIEDATEVTYSGDVPW